MSTTLAPSQSTLAHKNLVNETDWDTVVSYIVSHEEFEPEIAECLLNEVVGFLKMVSMSGRGRYAPSKMVDIAWHAFLMHTREYLRFCEEINGSIIHHRPMTMEETIRVTGGIKNTVARMEECGIVVNHELWSILAECDGSCDANGTCGGEGC